LKIINNQEVKVHISILWNVNIVLKGGNKTLIFSGYRDRECNDEDIIEKIKEMADELLLDLDKDFRNAFLKFGYVTPILMEMKRMEIQQ
jgi:hypothetical protein